MGKKDNIWTSIPLKKHLLNSVYGILIGLAITIIVLLSSGNSLTWNILLDSFIPSVVSYVLITLPEYLVVKQEEIKKEIQNTMSKMDNCPRMIALHTERNVFESHLNEINTINSGSERWIMSKYISKLLFSTFNDFEIDFKKVNPDNPTSEYSSFTSEILKECKCSVFLTGSMPPIEWLQSLSNNTKDVERKFFNNISNRFDINESNHSITLKNLANIDPKNKFRVVCLSTNDYDNLFLFVRHLEKYYNINNGINTSFVRWDDNYPAKKFKPLQF